MIPDFFILDGDNGLNISTVDVSIIGSYVLKVDAKVNGRVFNSTTFVVCVTDNCSTTVITPSPMLSKVTYTTWADPLVITFNWTESLGYCGPFLYTSTSNITLLYSVFSPSY